MSRILAILFCFSSIHEEFKCLKLTDLRIISTLGVGGFGRVELVQIAGDVKKRSFALKQMKKAQVRGVSGFLLFRNPGIS